MMAFEHELLLCLHRNFLECTRNGLLGGLLDVHCAEGRMEKPQMRLNLQ